MSITLADAQAALDSLVQAQAQGVTEFSAVSVEGRSYSYRSIQEILEGIRFWSEIVTRLRRQAAGGKRLGYSVANFRSCS